MPLELCCKKLSHKGDYILANPPFNSSDWGGERLRIVGHPVQDADQAHLSPCRFERINPYGKYVFEMTEDFRGAKLRPFRSGRSLG
jgi:hypothetical protein